MLFDLKWVRVAIYRFIIKTRSKHNQDKSVSLFLPVCDILSVARKRVFKTQLPVKHGGTLGEGMGRLLDMYYMYR